MKTRAIAIMISALVLAVSLTGCGAKDESSLMTAAPEAIKGEDALCGAEDGGIGYEEEAPAAYAPAADGEAVDWAADVAGVAEVAGAVAADMAVADDGLAGEEYCEPIDEPAPVISQPEAGILTAGEWKDHANWGFFSNLVNNGTVQFPSYGIDPTQRIEVTVSNSGGERLPNAEVQLRDASGAPAWQAVTDENGVAYLFETGGSKGVAVYASIGADGAAVEQALEAADGGDSQSRQLVSDRQVALTLESSVVRYADTQVMFIVDTTGSMGDEMLYLQSDFGAIAEEVGTDRTSYAVNFYRDAGDDYVTKQGCGFTGDVSQIRTALNSESADGGGDEPEAVAEALAAAFSDGGWSKESVKVAFLIFDAPPHTGTEDSLIASIESAAAQGIHLIPVVSSNGSRETELFGRAAAICTNGSYVFLTDHSGVGGSHLEPIIGDYEVEKLHDIIVRIITSYQQK